MSIAGKSLDFDPPAAQNAGPMPALRAVGLRSWTARRLERLAPKLTYGRLRLVLPDGGRLEFAGVKPDVEVPWKPNDLPDGDDNQVNAATDICGDN